MVQLTRTLNNNIREKMIPVTLWYTHKRIQVRSAGGPDFPSTAVGLCGGEDAMGWGLAETSARCVVRYRIAVKSSTIGTLLGHWYVVLEGLQCSPSLHYCSSAG